MTKKKPNEIKSFALLSKRTAVILEGLRVLLIDKDLFAEIPEYQVFAIGTFDGWVMTCPLPESGFGGARIFMNREWVEKEFFLLGEI